MTEAIESTSGENPYSSESPRDAGTEGMQEQRGPIDVRLWPAILIVLSMWFLIVVPGKIAPLTMVHFMSMQLGPVVSAVALAIWWLMSRRVPWRQRWLGLVIVVATLFIGISLAHGSMTITMLVYGMPIALTILIAALAIYRTRPWTRRRTIAYVGFASFFVASWFFRISDLDAAFSFTLVPRWTPTAEEEFLAELNEQGSAPSDVNAPSELPAEVGEADWAEFRGARRDGSLHGVTFSTDWVANPPKELWRRSVGPGWSAFSVVGSWAFTQEQRGEQEAVVAYRVDDGSEIWSTSISARFEASMGGIGPRATPTYSDGRLYVTGGTGVVQCLNASNGETLWQYDMVKELELTMPAWGFSSSPLLADGLAIVFAGGGEGKGVVALDQQTGERRWLSGDGYHGYSSPQLSTIDGKTHVVMCSNVGLRGLSAEDGGVLWKHDWDIGQMARVTQPLVVGNAVYLGTGYGNGTQRVNVSHQSDSWTVEESWIAPLKPYFNDFVHHDGHLYGFDNEIFVSIDAETGERNWKRGRYGNGQVLLVAEMGLLLVISEKGKIVLLEASPDQHQELLSIEAVEGVTWNHPVIAGGKLFVRNSEEAVCYELPEYKRSTN